MEKSKKQLLIEAKAAAMEELNQEITDLRMRSIAAYKELDLEDVSGSYRHSLKAIVQAAGNDGIELSLLKQVLPDAEILQRVRDELGTGTYTINEGMPNEQTLDGEKWIIVGKSKSKGNTLTIYPGERMKAETLVAQESVIEQEVNA